ncbi:hypothetical protein SCATT_28160 [Streptantibioticus cattleyicolor NRRL 8057 = DSM 46488]|uniref:Uncharacterized protein n=1 Tax=Streptantibioticus cattleyicolor (strain ATCC 35852 / DSM 46488 / JCM 4925 / NBRC 14057 / NRRL 8057) TaxID=1003195 RepID=G8WPK2_STREN|nr:hypothetical protein SCATT_28160 [Streptantibioticus cattleyicolor NRRL 8057 = DSM 46488]
MAGIQGPRRRPVLGRGLGDAPAPGTSRAGDNAIEATEGPSGRIHELLQQLRHGDVERPGEQLIGDTEGTS